MHEYKLLACEKKVSKIEAQNDASNLNLRAMTTLKFNQYNARQKYEL